MDMLDLTKTYSRKSDIIYENSIPIIRLKQKFIDIETMSENAISYMNRYFEMFPDLFEKVIQEKPKLEQLTLF